MLSSRLSIIYFYHLGLHSEGVIMDCLHYIQDHSGNYIRLVKDTTDDSLTICYFFLATGYTKTIYLGVSTEAITHADFINRSVDIIKSVCNYDADKSQDMLIGFGITGNYQNSAILK